MTFRKLTALIRKEMIILLRERQTIPLLFIMPMALIFFYRWRCRAFIWIN